MRPASPHEFRSIRHPARPLPRWFGTARFWILAVVLSVVPVTQARASQDDANSVRKHGVAADRFACGGKVERQSWILWDDSIRNWARKSLDDRLRRDGDVYVLYDMQTYLHNLAAMARRCNRVDRLMEIAAVLGPAYESLEPGGWLSPGRRWVCRGGRICSGRPGLLGQEVLLVSVQFLGLTSSIANALAAAQTPLKDSARSFIRTTSIVIAEHLQRWGDRKAIDKLADAAGAGPDDVRSMSSGLLFTDKPLWMIGIYAEWAGILDSKREDVKRHRPDDHEREAMAKHVHGLLRLFIARLSYRDVQHPHAGEIKIAELDRGFWRLFADHRYAGYEGMEKPLLCPDKANARTDGTASRAAPLLRIDAGLLPRRTDIGWDLSHARRLVHVLDALERNRSALSNVFALKDRELPPGDLAARFGNALVALSWNGDRKHPLFRNYLSGANGWYRVGVAAAGNCNEGTPPFGLSESFVTGGYAAWGGRQAIIRQLGRRMYLLVADSAHGAQGAHDAHDAHGAHTAPVPRAAPSGTGGNDFIARHYPAFSVSAPPMAKTLSNAMFLPSLVGVADE